MRLVSVKIKEDDEEFPQKRTGTFIIQQMWM